ncbi:hypothetical protein ACQEU6_33850 [Spirillospora sp. CA-108201]
MPQKLPLSGDPRAAAEQALHLAAASGEPVQLSFTGALDDVFDSVHHQDLTVTVESGTTADKVVDDLREEAQNPQQR